MGVLLHVRTCMSYFCIARTAGPISFKLANLCTCARAASVTQILVVENMGHVIPEMFTKFERNRPNCSWDMLIKHNRKIWPLIFRRIRNVKSRFMLSICSKSLDSPEAKGCGTFKLCTSHAHYINRDSKLRFWFILYFWLMSWNGLAEWQWNGMVLFVFFTYSGLPAVRCAKPVNFIVCAWLNFQHRKLNIYLSFSTYWLTCFLLRISVDTS